MRRVLLALAMLGAATAPALAKDLQFWNQTSKEFKGVYLAPAGTTHWGSNQTDNDDDHSVSADERLKITGVAAGKYDVRLVDMSGRICIVAGVPVKVTGRIAFEISEKQLTRCKP